MTILLARLRRVLTPGRILSTIFTISFGGLLISVVSEILAEGNLRLVIGIVGGIALVTGVGAAILYLRHPSPVVIVAKAPILVRTRGEAKKRARRGFVGFIPFFSAQSPEARNLSPEARQQAVKDLDYVTLRIEQSNMAPTIEAITTHASRLEHCWLIGTDSKKGSGSVEFAELLVHYLKTEKGIACEFHCPEAGDDEPYTVNMDDDALVFSQTHDVVVDVLNEAEQLGIETSDMVADITTGVRSMLLGMVFACLERDQDIELVGSQYTDTGGIEPNTLFPIIFDYELKMTT